MATNLSSNPQMGFDESVIADAALERALEKRLQAKQAWAKAQAAFDKLDEKARDAVASRELPPGVDRCGPHKITVAGVVRGGGGGRFMRSAKRERGEEVAACGLLRGWGGA